MGPTASVHGESPLAVDQLARGLDALRDARLHRLLPSAGMRHPGRYDGREGGDTPAAGSPLQRPATRLDHYRSRRAYSRARGADPAVHYGCKHGFSVVSVSSELDI